MKTSHSEMTIRYLILLKIDATNLFNRISTRASESIETFSLKRNRSIFKEIFENRYQYATMTDLSHCPSEVIEVLNDFYAQVDSLYWYLKTTQNMPNTIEDEVMRRIAKVSQQYETAKLFIDAELSGKKIEDLLPIEASNIHDLEFRLEGERMMDAKSEDFIQEEPEDITTE